MWLGLNQGRSAFARWASPRLADAVVAGSAVAPRPVPGLPGRGALAAAAADACSSPALRGGDAVVAQALTAPTTHTKPKPCPTARRRPFISLSRDVGETAPGDAASAKARPLELGAEPFAGERIEKPGHEHFPCASEKSASDRQRRHLSRSGPNAGEARPLIGMCLFPRATSPNEGPLRTCSLAQGRGWRR